MRVMTFGSSTLSDAGALGRVAELVRDATGDGAVAVVASALADADDALAEATDLVLADYPGAEAIFRDLHSRHLGLLEALVPAARRSPVVAEIQVLFNDLEDVLHGASLVGECSPGTRRLVASYGPRLGARIVAECLSVAGVDAHFVDSRPLVVTEEGAGALLVDVEESTRRLAEALAPGDSEAVAVVTGGLGADGSGATTSLGRHGSDYTATLVATALGAERVELWKDVEGVFTADPATVPDAALITELGYEEAQEMAYFGAAVVHPQALQPAAEREIPVVVRSSRHPERPGTTIGPAPGVAGPPVRAITTLTEVALVNVEGSGMIGVHGVAGRLFTALAAAAVNVVMISQASSEHSICFVVRATELDAAETAVRDAFARELEAGLVQRVEAVGELAILSVIGSRMRGTAGLSGRFFGALGDAGINVLAISQGSSERNISVVVAAADQLRALRAAHDAFGLAGGGDAR